MVHLEIISLHITLIMSSIKLVLFAPKTALDLSIVIEETSHELHIVMGKIFTSLMSNKPKFKFCD